MVGILPTGIDEQAWTAIRYPQAVWEATTRCPTAATGCSDAEVAEIDFVAFSSEGEGQRDSLRLVVRRGLGGLQPTASDGTMQGELFAAHRHHAFITNSTLSSRGRRRWERHRDHAIIEQVIAELKDRPLAHLPSGKYTANAAWLAYAGMAFNLARAIGVLAGEGGMPGPGGPPSAPSWIDNFAGPGRQQRPEELTLHLYPGTGPAQPGLGGELFDCATGPPAVQAA